MLQPAGETPEQHTCLRGRHVAPTLSVSLRRYTLVVMTRMLHICKQLFSASQPVSVSTCFHILQPEEELGPVPGLNAYE